MINFFRKYFFELMLVLIVLSVLIFSLSTLTTKPRLWTDEGLSIELARNFSLYGKLDVISSPGIFSGVPFLLQSTGYPMTIALAVFFKIFGLGLVQARLFALALMVILLILIYWFAKKQFGKTNALWAVFLIATFAPFYGNGRCITGEILGFIFFILGLNYFLDRYRLWLSGLFFGLAVVTKPSVYLLIIPAVLIILLIEKRQFFSQALKLFAGMLPAAFLWVVICLPSFFDIKSWLLIVNFYKNPFYPLSAAGNFFANLKFIPQSTTLIYFFILGGLVLGAFFVGKRQKTEDKNKRFLHFVIIYSVMAFAYFLKSPGWLRYLVAAQFLIFILLPEAIKRLTDLSVFSHFHFFDPKKIFYIAMFFLIILQVVQLFCWSDLFYSTASIDAVNFLNRQESDKTVGLINSIGVSGLILSEKKYQILNTLLGLPSLGQDFLAFEQSRLPDLVAAGPDDVILNNHKDTINKFYTLIYDNGKYNVYAKK